MINHISTRKTGFSIQLLTSAEHSLQPYTSSRIELSSKSKSIPLPNHKIALIRVTYYKQVKEQPAIDTDPNTILRNSLITSNFNPKTKNKLKRIISHELC
jgi:hypothetical protein